MKKWIKLSFVLLTLMIFRTGPAAANTYQIPLVFSVPAGDASVSDVPEATSKLVLGVHPEATAGYDPRWDTPAFFTTPDPENPVLLKVYARHPEYAENRQNLWRDIRTDVPGSRNIWDITVLADPAEIGKPVTVSWVLPPSLTTSREKVTLSDPETQTAIDMRAQSAYRFINSSASPKKISVTVDSSGESSDKGGGSGAFGCGVVKSIGQNPPGGGTQGAVLANLLLLLSPLLLRLKRFRTVS